MVPRQERAQLGVIILYEARAWAQANLNLLSAGTGPAMKLEPVMKY